jgi:hypothetical protein
MPHIRGGKGEAVLRYCEPVPTKEMGHHTAFPKGKKHGQFPLIQDFTFCELLKNGKFSPLPECLLENISLGHVFYATFGIK